jgi:hypothetical protein
MPQKLLEFTEDQKIFTLRHPQKDFSRLQFTLLEKGAVHIIGGLDTGSLIDKICTKEQARDEWKNYLKQGFTQIQN